MEQQPQIHPWQLAAYLRPMGAQGAAIRGSRRADDAAQPLMSTSTETQRHRGKESTSTSTPTPKDIAAHTLLGMGMGIGMGMWAAVPVSDVVSRPAKSSTIFP